MSTATRKLEFSVSVDSLTAIGADGIHYNWSCAAESWKDRAAAREAYEKANPGANVVSLSGVNADYDTDHAFIFYIADCMSPPLYLVFGRSFEDAHETFITEFERLVKIEDTDIKDYDEESITYNDNGTAVDTESVQYLAVAKLIVHDSSKASK